MPVTNGNYSVPNNFTQQYNLGQKKIRADLVDENFSDGAVAINSLLSSVSGLNSTVDSLTSTLDTLASTVDANDLNAVHKTGNETIAGDKTFTGNVTMTGDVSMTGNVSLPATYATTAWVNANAKKVSSKGTRSVSGNWSITNLIVGMPLFILYVSVSEPSSSCFIFTVGGAQGGNTLSTNFVYRLGPSSDNNKSTDVFVVIPTSTTVVLACGDLGDDDMLIAYQ